VASEGLVRLEDRATSGLSRAEEIWTPEQRIALARYLGVAPDNPGLFPMLAVCAAWGLDPFAGQVWLIKQKGRSEDGAERWRPSAGRDGYLAIANRQTDFKGVQGDVVRQHDKFDVEWQSTPDGMFPTVKHSYVQGLDEEGEVKVRGEILGAWAILFRDGRLPVYYFAPWTEHRRDPEKTAWSYKSAMILKAAQSMVLRLGYSITGLVPYDEMRAGTTDGPPSADITLGADDAEALSSAVVLPESVTDLIDRARRLGQPWLVDRGTAEMVVDDQSDEFVAEWVETQHAELDAIERGLGATGRTPPPGDPDSHPDHVGPSSPDDDPDDADEDVVDADAVAEDGEESDA
jgi:hypothetical protein